MLAYKAVKDYWNESESVTDALQRYTENVPLTSVTMEIDYAEKDTLGALSGFIIDLDENVHSATIQAVYKVSDNIESILGKCRDAYNLISDKAKSDSVKDEIIAQIVKEYFLSFFQLQILAIDPTNLTNTAIKGKTDLKNIFYLKTIRAERSLDESDAAPVNPLGQVMKKLLGMKPSDIEDEIKPSIVELQKLIADVNYNVQSQVNEQMNKLVNQMTPFGYPDGEDLQLKANTTLSIENRIVDSTGLTYLSQDGSETLPESHNGLGYKNLIKISMELHILSNRYPVILIDEYQDSFEKIMSQFVKYFIEPECGPQFGLFGDAWQTIYSASGACGLVESEKLKEIRKETNFRSEKVIVEALNRMRPELPQISALDQTDGNILVITTNNIDETNRIAKGRDKGDLKEEIRKDVVEKVQRKLQEQGWQENTKILMLTHNYLAMQQGYQRLHEVLGNHFRNQDDIHFQYFQNLVEPVFHALQNNDAKRLAEILGTSCSPVLSYNYKQKWNRFGRDLEKARKKVIYDVINIVADSGLLDIPPKIKAYSGS